MKKKQCQIGGPLYLNPNNPYATPLPGFGGIDHQALMNAHPITGQVPGMTDIQNQDPYTIDKKWQFGLNYGHIATSNFIQAGLAGLRRQRQEKDFQSYNQAQSNPLLQIPFSPNTTNASLYGQPLMKKGGLIKNKSKFQAGGDVFGIEDEMENDIMMEAEQPVQIEQEAPEQVIQAPEEDYSEVLKVNNTARLAYEADDSNSSLEDEDVTTLPTPADTGINGAIQDFKQSIASAEGAGYFMPTQIKGSNGKPASSAFGKYQFIKGTREQVRKQFFPDIPSREFENMYKTSPMFQEQVMDKYSGYLLDKYGGDKRKAATAFFLGEGKVGKVDDLNYRPTAGNATVGQYLNRAKFQKGGSYQDSLKLYNQSKKAIEQYWGTPMTDERYKNVEQGFWAEDYNQTLKDQGLTNAKIKPTGFATKSQIPYYPKPTTPNPPKKQPKSLPGFIPQVSTSTTPFDQHLEASINGQKNWELAKKNGKMDNGHVYISNEKVNKLPYSPINTSVNPSSYRYTTETTGQNRNNNREFPLYNKPRVADYLDIDVRGRSLTEQAGPYGITWPTFNQVDGHGQHTANFPDAASWNAAKQVLGTPQSSTQTGNSGTALYPAKPTFKEGGAYFLSDKQIAELKKQGYEIEE